MINTTRGYRSMQINRMGFGGSHLSLPTPIEDQALTVLLNAAIGSGINFIDTADCYGWRASDANAIEARIASTLRDLQADDLITVGTKGGFIHHEGEWTLNGHPDHLFEAIRKSFLAAGGNKPLRLWQLHAVDPDYPISVSLRAAVRAQEAGWVQHVGVCNVHIQQLEEALTVLDVVSVQNQSSPWFSERDEGDILRACETHKITFLAHTPLGGWQAWKAIQFSPLLKQLSREHNTSVYSILLSWLLRKSPCIAPLVGTCSPVHLVANLASYEVILTDENITQLESAFESVRKRMRPA